MSATQPSATQPSATQPSGIHPTRSFPADIDARIGKLERHIRELFEDHHHARPEQRGEVYTEARTGLGNRGAVAEGSVEEREGWAGGRAPDADLRRDQ